MNGNKRPRWSLKLGDYLGKPDFLVFVCEFASNSSTILYPVKPTRVLPHKLKLPTNSIMAATTDYGYEPMDYGYGQTEPDYGYGDAKPDEPMDYGYGDAQPDYGYGDAQPDNTDYGYGDAKPDDTDYGYGSSQQSTEFAAPAEQPKKSRRRRCSVTQYNLGEDGSALTAASRIQQFRQGAATNSKSN